MPWLLPSIIAVLAGTFVLTVVYFYLYSQDRQKFLLVWATGWAVYLLRFCFMLVMLLTREAASLNAAYHLSALVSGVLLLWGTHLFIGRPLSRAWIAGSAVIGVWITVAVAGDVAFLAFALPNFLFLGVVYIWTGWVFLRVRRGMGGRIVGWAFILWGIHKADYPFLRPITWFAPWGYVLSSVLELTVAIGMLLVYFQKMKSELVEKEERVREILENVHLVAVTLDREGNVTFCNKYFLNLTGWSLDEVVGKNWFELFIPGNMKAEMTDYHAKLIAGWSVPLHHENVILTRKGEHRLVVWDNTLMRGAGDTIVGTAGIGIDMTEHRKLEEQLRQAQKMEAVGQLAGGIAHDFNNILTAIVGYAHLLKMRMEKDNPLLMNVEPILESAQRAASLTHSLLAFGRKQAISIKPVDLNAIIRKMEKLLLRVIGEDIEMRTALGEGPLTALADAGQVEQVLMNLATNARDAMPKGGCLTIRSERREIDETFIETHGYGEPGAFALISVSDTGVGMDERTREKIFEPFFTTKEVGKGTGLGLAMVYGIVKQHRGFITVQSELGKGTTFDIYLSLAVRAGVEAEGTAGEETGGMPRGVGTLLVAEDDDILRALTSSVLREFGYTVIEARDGEETVQRFVERKEDIRLVILDVVMPKKSGKEAYDEIRNIEPAVKALFVSGYAPDTVRDKGLLDGGAELLMKPLSPQDLLKKVRDILAS
jgi:PAS domain S-box-containing protein